jgi:hypothetical protein
MYRSLFGDFDFMEMFLGWDYHACKRRCRLTLGCSNRIIGPAFFIIWTLIGLVVLFNMYVATLSHVSYFVWLTNRFRTCLLPSSWKAMKLRRSLEVNFSLAWLEDCASRCPCPGCRSFSLPPACFAFCGLITFSLARRRSQPRQHAGRKFYEAHARKLSGNDAQTAVRALSTRGRVLPELCFLQNRGDELVQPIDKQKEQQNLSVGDGAAHTNAGTGGSAVASLATDNARTRAVDEAESANSLRQPASLQVGNI